MAAINNITDPQFEIYKKRLFNEAKQGNLVMIKALAKKNPALLNYIDDSRHTALHWAAGNSDLNVIEWVLSDEGRAAGFSSVLSRAEGDLTALHLAAVKGDLECFKAIVFGCKEENGEREQMLHAVEEDRHTVLHYAAMSSNTSIVEWLLSDKKGGGREAGFNSVLATGKNEMTALHGAAKQDDLACFKAIVEGCKVQNGERKNMLNAVTDEGYTVLHVAAHHGHISIIKWLLSKGRDKGFESILARTTNASTATTALDEAAHKGQLEACKAIVEGCKVENGEREQMLNGVDERGLTALHFAAFTGQTSVVNWLLSDKQGGGRTMGFYNVLARTKKGSLTALHLAAQNGHLETCKAIVEGCKAENGERKKMLNALSELGLTVVHYAATSGRPDIVTWLLSDDGDGGRANGLKSETITAVTNRSFSSLHSAAYFSSVETLRALLSGCTVGERLRMFLTVDRWGWTALHWAARLGRVDNIRELLLHHEETKMIVDHRDHRGMTALHRVILDGGVDEESKREWKLGVKPDGPNSAPREEVIAALLTYEFDDDEEKGRAKGQAAASTKKTNKKKKQQQQRPQQQQKQQQQKQQQQQQQQAAFIDVNLGLKIE